MSNLQQTIPHRAAAEINAAAQDILVYDDGSDDIDLREAGFAILNTLRKLPVVSYADAVREAAGLLDPPEPEGNPEYLRGMSELMARLFGDSVLGTEGDTVAGSCIAEGDILDALGTS